MKNISQLFLLFCFVVLVSSCSKQEEILIEPPAPTTTEEQGSWELTYDPSNISTEQEIFEGEGVTDSDQETGEEADSPTMNTTIDVERTPLGGKNISTTTTVESTTIGTFTRSE